MSINISENLIVLAMLIYFSLLAAAVIVVDVIAVDRTKHTYMQTWMKGVAVFWNMEDYFKKEYIVAVKILNALWIISFIILFAALFWIF